MLVLIGATREDRKKLLGFQVGLRGSRQSWRELLVDLKAPGLTIVPELARGDGSHGSRKEPNEVLPTTQHQRCTAHKPLTYEIAPCKDAWTKLVDQPWRIMFNGISDWAHRGRSGHFGTTHDGVPRKQPQRVLAEDQPAICVC